MSEYREAFERLWNAGATDIVPNSKSEHAADLISVFFQKASSRVQIFCKNLAPTVYDSDELLFNAISAANRRVKIEVITQEGIPDNSKFCKELESAGKEPSALVNFINRTSLPASMNELEFNFIIADDHAYRFEPDRNNFSAFACANDKEKVKILSSIFDKLKEVIILHAASAAS